MIDNPNIIYESVIHDLSEGVMVIGMNGRITFVNPAAESILGQESESMVGKTLSDCFFRFAINDAFVQTILDSIYDPDSKHEGIVPFFDGDRIRQLRVATSFLRSEDVKTAVIAVLNDISELAGLKDAVASMHRIQELNEQLKLRNRLLNETFGRFLSDDIVRHLLETPDGLRLGGKKTRLSVLMSDLRGFTAMSERMEATNLLNMLNHYLGEMTEAIEARGGSIIEFIGDGILAIFGAPEATATHATDAICAALDMQRRMDSVNRWNAERGYPVLQMGIGINTGEGIIGNIGSEKRSKYGVTGSLVNLCGRIESYSVGGQVLIAPETRASAGAELTVEQEIEIRPKGVSTPVLISQISAIGAPYSISCHTEAISVDPLDHSVPVNFSVLEGKHGTDATLYAVVTSVGRDSFEIQTEAPLQLFDNLVFEAGGQLFAKVISRSSEGWIVSMTSVPEEYGKWCGIHGIPDLHRKHAN